MEAVRFLTPDEVAERWRIPVSTLKYWRERDRGPRFTRIGGRYRYRLADVLAFESSEKRSA